jgi:hypothetical protein
MTTARPAVRLVLLGAAGLFLPACGATATLSTQPAAAAQASPSGGGAVAPLPEFTVPPVPPAPNQLDMSRPLHRSSICQRREITLREAIRESGPAVEAQYGRAAVIATVLSVGAPRWNSPDGHRWTTAELDSRPGLVPEIYRPLSLQVQRLLSPANGVSAGQTITAYLHGGVSSTGDVDIDHCVAVLDPQAGMSAVVFLGLEFLTDQGGAAPLRSPTVGEFDPIRDGQVQTFFGPQAIP